MLGNPVMSDENPYAAPTTDSPGPLPLSGAPGPHNYATLGARFFGKMIDVLIMVPVSLVLIAVLSPIFVQKDPETLMEIFQGGAGFGIVGALVFSLIGLICYIAVQWTFWKKSSQSIGKKVMKIQVVNLDGSPAAAETIAFNRYALMAALTAIPFIGQFIALVNVLLIFRGDRNCLHDDLAKTRVIKLSATSNQ